MSNTFNELEILKVAMLMEEEGRAFYTNGAKYADGRLKDFLIAAAGQEILHKELFSKLYDELSSKINEDYNYLFDPEVISYFKDLIENKVFDKKTPQEDAFKDLKSAIEYSIKSEELTVEVYTKMYEGIERKDVKDVLAKIIEEEKIHIEEFKKLL